MKKILLSILIIISLFFVTDQIIGTMIGKLYENAKYGYIKDLNYTLKNCNEEILLLGSSATKHHYIPTILTDSLHQSCFNAGSDANCIFYHYTILSSMIKRGYHPKIVIIDLNHWDLIKSEGGLFSLEYAVNCLKPYYGELDILDSLLNEMQDFEHIKLLSKTYRFNSLIAKILVSYISSQEQSINGFVPLNGIMDISLIRYQKEDLLNKVLDNKKLSYLHKLISLTKKNDIKLFFVKSPSFNRIDLFTDIFKDLSNKYNIPFIDMRKYDVFKSPLIFNDTRHLNYQGAIEFSKILSKEIKNVLKN